MNTARAETCVLGVASGALVALVVLIIMHERGLAAIELPGASCDRFLDPVCANATAVSSSAVSSSPSSATAFFRFRPAVAFLLIFLSCVVVQLGFRRRHYRHGARRQKLAPAVQSQLYDMGLNQAAATAGESPGL